MRLVDTLMAQWGYVDVVIGDKSLVMASCDRDVQDVVRQGQVVMNVIIREVPPARDSAHGLN